jgi:hypothetical protein
MIELISRISISCPEVDLDEEYFEELKAQD